MSGSKNKGKERETDASSWIGFDLGGSKMLSIAYDDQLKPFGRRRRKTKSHGDANAGVRQIIDTIYEAMVDGKVRPEQLGGIGIGCPGPLDLNEGILFDAPNLGWKNLRLKDALQDEFGCPVVLVNDVDSGLYGEYRFGAGRKGRCVLGVFPGTGIGGGCVYEGKIIRGARSSCMEIGHVQVMPDGPLCGCGQRGCLEAVASRLAIASAAAAAAYRGAAPHLLEDVGTDLTAIRSGALARSVEAGDAAVGAIVRAAAQMIGIAVAGVVHLLAPDIVVLGGGLVEAMPELFVEEVERAARDRVLPSYAESFRVVAAELGDDAAVMGAASWAREEIGRNRS
ncbi:MAG: ROK family protein [Pirellulales bacterium]